MSQQFATDALGDANCYFVADGRDFGFAAKEFPNSSDTSDNRLFRRKEGRPSAGVI